MKWKDVADSTPTETYVLSLISAILMAALSLGGLLFPSTFYPTDELLQSFVANDVVNLFIGLPILLGSMWLARRGKLVGLLLWPGALLYILYNYIVYAFGVPFSFLSFAYITLVLLGVYGLLDLLKRIDGRPVQERLSRGVGVPVKIAGSVLVVLGLVFTLRATLVIAEAGLDQTMLPLSEIGLLIADIVLSIIVVCGGFLLLKRRPLGYVAALGLLFAASMLFIGLIMFLLLQPVLTDAPFVLVDIIVVLLMGLICFIPFGLFLRGVVLGETTIDGDHPTPRPTS
jgi:hypothetical protein